MLSDLWSNSSVSTAGTPDRAAASSNGVAEAGGNAAILTRPTVIRSMP